MTKTENQTALCARGAGHFAGERNDLPAMASLLVGIRQWQDCKLPWLRASTRQGLV
jgi:hypothetical protein